MRGFFFLTCLLAQLFSGTRALLASPLLSRSLGRQRLGGGLLSMTHTTQTETAIATASLQMRVRKGAAKVALLVGLFSSSGLGVSAPALADLDSDFEVTSTVTAVRALTFKEAAAPDASSSSSKPATKAVSADSITDDSYLNSLDKEQKKQNARKKTKTERSRDLCESLGRGC